jgi:hypothetical protein
LYDGDLPVILGHVMGLPVEESAVQFAAAGAAITTTMAIGWTMVGRMLDRIRRR